MRTIAIVVGVAHYQDSTYDTLPGATADAGRFSSALVSWGLPKECCFVILNEKATKINIIKAFFDCKPYFDSDAKFVFYFAGHGERRSFHDHGMQESALVLHDTNSHDPLGSGLRLVELMQLIRALAPSQVFLFIDACSLRLNQIENPLSDQNILSTINSRGLFCLFSSGIQKSYEDEILKYGYFTHALLKALGELRRQAQANCYDIVKKVSATLTAKDLPLPESYHIGFEKIWPLERHYEGIASKERERDTNCVLRWEALARLQDHLVSYASPIIWMWGEGGRGKTVIAEQFKNHNAFAIYTSVNANDTVLSLVEQVRSKKNELFYNRPFDASLHQNLNYIFSRQTNTILIVDHLDRLAQDQLQEVISEIDRTTLPCIIINRTPCPKQCFKNRQASVVNWEAESLTLEEIEQMIGQHHLGSYLSSILLTASGGNAIKVRYMLAKLATGDVQAEEKMTDEFVHGMSAIVACGGFIDEPLFCKTFNVKSEIVTKLEKLGLIRYTAEGCIPHDILVELVDENQWALDTYNACNYWNLQIRHTPYNRWACRSLVILASQEKDCSSFKKPLSRCLEVLNQKGEHISFIIDLISIFKRENWDDLLLKSTTFLLDNEQFQVAESAFLHLLKSQDPTVKKNISKYNARRLVLIGQFEECIQLCTKGIRDNKSPSWLFPLRNYAGIANYFLGFMDKAMHFFQENLKRAHGKIDRYDIALATYMAGIIMVLTSPVGQLSKAKKLFEESLQIFESLKNFIGTILVLNGLGILFYRQKKWHPSLHHLNRAAEIAETLSNKGILLFTLGNKAITALRLFGPNSAELNELVAVMESMLSDRQQYANNWTTMFALDALAAIYAQQREIQKLQDLIGGANVEPGAEGWYDISILAHLGLLAGLKKDYQKAQEYCQSAYSLAKKLNNQYVFHDLKKCIEVAKLPIYLKG